MRVIIDYGYIYSNLSTCLCENVEIKNPSCFDYLDYLPLKVWTPIDAVKVKYDCNVLFLPIY